MKETGRMISGKTIGEWIEEYPIVEELCELKETVWINPHRQSFEQAAADCQFSMADIMEASDRLDRFAAYFRKAFPETEKTNGIIESPVKCIPNMKEALELRSGKQIHGSLWAKLDSHLAVSGSIKARGGIYEVLKHAEDIALENGMLKPGDSYEVFDSEEFRRLFSGYSIGVGSTGNLGLSIGIMSAKLGFKVTVHMSADARQWKKDMLRSKGVIVKEYESDYSVAVREGRAQAEGDPYCYFVDDENSQTLFMGYAVAALRLKKQLEAEKVSVDSEHPLFVYLPCGVGGGPGGVAFGLKMVFGDAVHCFFAEPVHSPCMILGMATGEDSNVSVQDFGIDNVTVADGLAVGRASGFVGSVMKPFMDGCYTLTDDRMFRMLALMADSEGIYLEPSALAGMFGALLQESSEEFGRYIEDEGLKDKISAAVHMAWLTGGSMVPEDEMKKYYERGKSLL